MQCRLGSCPLPYETKRCDQSVAVLGDAKADIKISASPPAPHRGEAAPRFSSEFAGWAPAAGWRPPVDGYIFVA
jgi:hypothetical protein